MLLAIVGSGLTLWVTIIVCCIVAFLLFVKVIKFWLKAILLIGLIILIGKCYFNRKTTSHGRHTYHVTAPSHYKTIA
jgi:hypothetical protein